MEKIPNRYLTALLLSMFFVFNPNISATAATPPVSIDIGGAINNHDMMMLKEKQRWHEEKIDIDNFNKNKKNVKEEVISGDDINAGEVEVPTRIFDKNSDKEIQKQKFIEKEEKKQKKIKFFRKKNKNDIKATEPEIIEAEIEITETSSINGVDADGKVYIKAVKVSESKILSDYEIQSFVNPIIGKYITYDELQEVVNNINYTYATRGYLTAKAYIPPQKLEDHTIQISLMEGTVGDLSILNNKYTSTSFIEKRLPVKEGEVLQIVELENGIIDFNRHNPGIKLNANLNKGKKVGTTDINIVAEEKFPFHVVGLMDNAGRYTIGELRGGLMMYSDSLFKQRDKLTIGSYASSHSITPFADYNIPVNKKDGRVGFLFSTSYSEISHGPYKMFDINSRSFNYALYYTHPLIRKPNFELTSYTAINYKQAATSFGGYEINKDKITSAETALNARYDTKRGIWYVSQGVYHSFPIFDDKSKYFKYTGSLLRLHDFGHGIVGQFRGMYQYSPTDVMPYIDQFQAGGIATVRGYSEGLLIGRSGYILSAEIMFPFLPQNISIKKNGEKKKIPFLGRYVKGIAFVDHAGIYPFKGEGPGAGSYNKNDYMISAGMGLRISLPGDASARLYWGYPLMHNNNERDPKHPRFSFEISLAPDFDKILSLKRKKQMQKKENL